MGGMWFLSPSGWPTFADTADEQAVLSAAGYVPMDVSQVQAAIDAYHAGTPAPTGPRFVTVDDLGDPASDARVELRAAFVPFWEAAETVTAGTIRMAPDGHTIERTADGTTRASYDATEQAAWTVVSGGGTSLTPGTAAGDILVWDGDSYEPQAPTEVTAADVPFTPTGTISSTDVQAAIAEVAAEAGSGSTPDAWMGFAATGLTPLSNSALTAAGRLHFQRVTRGAKAGATKIGIQVSTTSGNVMVGVYSAAGSGLAAVPGALKGSSVVTVCPAAGYAEIPLQAATDVEMGDYLALWCDSASAIFGYLVCVNRSGLAALFDLGTGATQLPAGPMDAGSMSSYGRMFTLIAS